MAPVSFSWTTVLFLIFWLDDPPKPKRDGKRVEIGFTASVVAEVVAFKQPKVIPLKASQRRSWGLVISGKIEKTVSCGLVSGRVTAADTVAAVRITPRVRNTDINIFIVYIIPHFVIYSQYQGQPGWLPFSP